MIEIGKKYELLELYNLVIVERAKAVILEEAKQKIVRCHQYLHQKINESESPIYGISTGFGSLYNQSIPNDQLNQLQVNLLRSHACGTGDTVPAEMVRLMLILKAQSLAQGFSGVQLQTVEGLIHLYNHDILPVVYELGSLGASGDLAPLAHLSLPLIGEGKVSYKGKIQESNTVLNELKLEPIQLQAKEGLALINGTQFMQAYGVMVAAELKKLIQQANFIGAMSFDAFNCNLSPLKPQSHQIRNQEGQLHCAAEINENLSGSEIATGSSKEVQDPYSFRCMPQVHGASWDALQHIVNIFNREINAVTDNPNVFPEDDMIVSAGNFHGQTLALQLDFASIAISEIANISERRIYKLISGERGLTPYLIKDPGINSGLMIAQYTAASIVSLNKQYATPSSVDSIVSSNGQEDHVSMGANAATKAWKIIQNANRVLQIEMMAAFQAFEFRKPLKSSPSIEKVIDAIASECKAIASDVIMHNWLNKVNKDEVIP